MTLNDPEGRFSCFESNILECVIISEYGKYLYLL